MRSDEFAKILEGHGSIQNQFKGVFPYDMAPKTLEKLTFIILNTE